MIAGLAVGLAIVSVLSAWAWRERRDAIEKSRVAVSQRLAAESESLPPGTIDHQLLLAAEAFRGTLPHGRDEAC